MPGNDTLIGGTMTTPLDIDAIPSVLMSQASNFSETPTFASSSSKTAASTPNFFKTPISAPSLISAYEEGYWYPGI